MLAIILLYILSRIYFKIASEQESLRDSLLIVIQFPVGELVKKEQCFVTVVTNMEKRKKKLV